MIGARIKQARLACGLTLDGLSEKMAAAGHSITKAALSKYELSKSIPGPAFLAALAKVLLVRRSYFSEASPVNVAWIGFRKRSSMSIAKQEHVQAFASQVVENQLWLQQLLYPQLRPALPEPRQASSMDDAESAAADLRKAWNLDDSPIDSLTATVENHGGVVVACEDISQDFDGLAGRTNSGFPVAVVSMEASADRRRYSLAHEIGHLLLLLCASLTDKATEQLANRFASALIVPPAVARSELGSKRRRLDFRELGLLKEKYGLSIQGWIRRAADLQIIEESQYKNLCIEISRNQWRKVEPFDFRGNETPSRLKQMTLRAFSEGVISERKAEQITPGCTEKMVPHGKEKLSAAEIRRLPRAQRSAMLASAAAMAESEYATNRDLTSFEAYGEDDLYDDDVKSPQR